MSQGIVAGLFISCSYKTGREEGILREGIFQVVVTEQSSKVLGINPGMNCNTSVVYSQALGALHWEGKELDSQGSER